MSYLQRKMFANGGSTMGPARPIGDYQIRDLKTGEILIDLRDRPDFIKNPAFNPYKILSDPTLEKGPAVLSILQNFQKQDAPKLGPFQADEDIGTNLADLGFAAARATEPFVRSGSRILGELTGLQAAKDFGGTQEFDPTFSMMPGLVPGADLFKPSYESYVPTEEDRARAQIGILKGSDAIGDLSSDLKEDARPFLEDAGTRIADFFDLGYPYGTPDYSTPIDPATGKVSPRVQDMRKGTIDSLLEEIKPVDVNKTEADSIEEVKLKFEGLKDGDLKKGTEELFEIIKPGQDPRKPISPLDAITKKEIEDYDPGLPEDKKTKENILTDTDGDPISRKLNEPGFFGSDNFLNFIRNVGGELVRTGQMDQGLSLGAAKAAEERAARELLADQEERKYKREIELATAKAEATVAKPMSTEKIIELNEKMITDMNEFKGGVAATGFVDLAIETIREAKDSGESVGGAGGFINSLFDKVGAFFGTGAEFEDLSAQEKVNKLVQVVRQKNLQAILGESGRTISDRDRIIILEVFGDLSAFQSAELTLGKLEESRRGLADNNESRKRIIETTLPILGQQGIYGQQFFSNLLPIYGEIQGIDPQASQAAAVLQRFLGQSVQSGIEEISL
tara:strand:- start:461 stop:2326 length:1866 start_codon:yes stop_codon:yes gene_type:complete